MVFSQSRIRHPDRYGASDPAEFHVSPDLAAIEPALDRHFRQGRLSSNRASIGRQVFRAIFYSLVIAAVAGLPLAWQFGDKNTKDLIAAWTIPLDKWSSASATKPLPAAAETVSKISPTMIPDRAATPDTSSPQAARAAQPAPAPVSSGSAQELQRQLETISGDLAGVRRLVEQLAARQNQMAQDLAAIQAAERDVSQKLSPVSQPTAHAPPHKNPAKPLPLGAPPQSSPAPLPAARPQEPPPSQ
jgi:hypothetical protein